LWEEVGKEGKEQEGKGKRGRRVGKKEDDLCFGPLLGPDSCTTHYVIRNETVK